MTEDKNNIISMRSDSTPTSGGKAGRSKSKYIAPKTSDNPSAFYLLPSNEQILEDFKLAAGCFDDFIEKNFSKDHRQVAAIQVMEQIAQDPLAQQEFNIIRAAYEQSEALLARDEIIRLSKTKGQSQITALKLVQEFKKDHKGLIREAIDAHLEDIPDEA